MKYFDGFVVPVPKKEPRSFTAASPRRRKNLAEHGALETRECSGHDLDIKMGVPFPRITELKPGETVVFGTIGFKSRAHRDRVNAKVMKHRRLAKRRTRAQCRLMSSAWPTAVSKILVDV